MTSHNLNLNNLKKKKKKFDPKLNLPSVTLKCLFYLQLYTECHTIEYPPPHTGMTSFMNDPLIDFRFIDINGLFGATFQSDIRSMIPFFC